MKTKQEFFISCAVFMAVVLAGCGRASSPVEIVKQKESFYDPKSRTYEQLVKNYQYFAKYDEKNWAVDSSERNIRPQDIPDGLEAVVLAKRVTYNTTLSIQDDMFVAFLLGSGDTELEGMDAHIVEDRSEITQIGDFLQSSLVEYHGRVFFTDEEEENLKNLITEIRRNSKGEISFANIRVSLLFITTGEDREFEGEYTTGIIGMKVIADITIQSDTTVKSTDVPFIISPMDILTRNMAFCGEKNWMTRKKPFDEKESSAAPEKSATTDSMNTSLGNFTVIPMSYSPTYFVSSNGDALNVRDAPGGTVLFKLNDGDNVKILAVTQEYATFEGIQDRWANIQSEKDGQRGWVFGGFLGIERGGPKYPGVDPDDE